MERAYQNREIDSRFEEVHKRFDDQNVTLGRIEKKQDYTNGKLKKIIIAIAVIVGAAVGFAGKELIPILINLLI